MRPEFFFFFIPLYFLQNFLQSFKCFSWDRCNSPWNFQFHRFFEGEERKDKRNIIATTKTYKNENSFNDNEKNESSKLY